MKKFLMSFLFVMFASTNVYCEPSKTTKYLMDEPVSLMDFGLYRIKQHLNQDRERIEALIRDDLIILEEKAGKPAVSIKNYADYDLKSNKIIITLLVRIMLTPQIKTVTIKRICKEVIPALKVSKYDFLSYFLHNGYQKTNMPDRFADGIFDIMKIKIDISYIGKEEEEKKLTCECMMAESQILFSE